MIDEPRVYVSGLHKMHLNIRKMLEWIVHALVLSAVVFWITFGSLDVSGQWDAQYVLKLWLQSCCLVRSGCCGDRAGAVG